ncbi:putative catabolite repression protein creC isoform X2 [Gossypium australe]|uniref:Putative catabolite repression protein creC isoform X2 n=1 Tax=Gossypium australe TaxID=47621 RepID=A0A5B6UAV1_9ROSI|nr:putative catabolite repression protein creC isoform X2 [Gossypium australe]
MINTANGMMSTSSSSANAQSPGLKTYFKTPEGRYKLHYEKTHPSSLLHYAHGKTVTQVTLAHLKDKPAPSTPTASSSSFGASTGVKSAAARWLGSGNGSRALSFVGGNGGSKSISSTSRIGSLGTSSSSTSMTNTNFDGKGTYLISNVGDAIFISDLNSQEKDPIKSIHFSNSNPVCHAFDQDAKEGHDLLIGLNSGDVYSVSLRQQLQDVGKKLVGAHHYNKDGCVNNRQD